MKTPNYKYLVLDSEGPADLTLLINTSAEGGWELVPGQSVTVASYTVIMRKPA